MQILLIKRYVIWTKFPQMKSLYFKRFYHLRKKKTIRIYLTAIFKDVVVLVWTHCI